LKASAGLPPDPGGGEQAGQQRVSLLQGGYVDLFVIGFAVLPALCSIWRAGS
jgi:hypothetical protein